MSVTSSDVAKALIEIGGVGFAIDNPITFKSGILSPMYMDNRRFPYYPAAWKVVLEGFAEKIKEKEIDYDVIAGIESAGIPHSAGLGVITGKPSVFVRKQVKDHGTKKMVEGGDVKAKKILLIEDLVTTGGSSLAGVRALRSEGATVECCLVIVSYDLEEAKTAFEKEKVELIQLTDVPTILEVAKNMNVIGERELRVAREWYKNPRSWGK